MSRPQRSAALLVCFCLWAPVTRTGDAADDAPGILLQLETEPTFASAHLMVPFGRVPDFTLYETGSVIYTIQSPGPLDGDFFYSRNVEIAQLTSSEIESLFDRLSRLGLARLESYEDTCIDEPARSRDGPFLRACTSDASVTQLRYRSTSGEMVTLRNYAEHANDPEALREVRGLLREFWHPAGENYLPQKAALFVRAHTTTRSVGRGWPDLLESWPLDRKLLAHPRGDDSQWAVVLDADQLGYLLHQNPRNFGMFHLEEKKTSYVFHVVPWLPGQDFSAEVAEYGQR